MVWNCEKYMGTGGTAEKIGRKGTGDRRGNGGTAEKIGRKGMGDRRGNGGMRGWFGKCVNRLELLRNVWLDWKMCK